MKVEDRARGHAALGDPHRLRLVDALALGDLTVAELSAASGMKTNLLAHHLSVLEEAALIERRVSEGDRRRRYVSLRWESLPVVPPPGRRPGSVVFICTRNSARSQFASAVWRMRTGADAGSAGSHPATQVNPMAVKVAAEFGVDLSTSIPAGYESIGFTPDLVVSVCDRARETDLPSARSNLHWSVPDPVLMGTKRAFRDAFVEIGGRVNRLAGSIESGS